MGLSRTTSMCVTVFPSPRWRCQFRAIYPSLLAECDSHDYWTCSFSSKHEPIAHFGRRLEIVPPLKSRVSCRRLLPSPPRASPWRPGRPLERHSDVTLPLRCERAWSFPVVLERWRSVGLPLSGECLLSSSAPPSRSTLVCRYRPCEPCSRPCPCQGVGHLVMQPTSRSPPSGTPAPPLEPPASSLLSPANLNLALLMLKVSLILRVVGGRLALPSHLPSGLVAG